MSFLVGWLTATGTGTGTGTWAWTSPNLPKAKAKAKANFHLSDAAVSRQDALKTLGSAASAAAAAALLVFSPTPSARAQAETLTLPSGVTYEVVKSGDGPKPEVGELIAIRFAAFCGPNKIDDIFETPEPYCKLDEYCACTCTCACACACTLACTLAFAFAVHDHGMPCHAMPCTIRQ